MTVVTVAFVPSPNRRETMKRSIWPWLSVSTLFAFAACSGSTSSGSGAAADPIPEDQLLRAYAAAICNNIGSCCEVEGFVHDQNKCGEVVLEELELPNTADGRVVYDANAAGACVRATAEAAKNCREIFAVECDDVFKGTLAPGEACTSSIECASAGVDEVRCEYESKVCVVSPRGAVGDGCGATCNETESGGIECSGSGGSTGGPEPGPADCYKNDGLACGADYKCTPLAGLGEPCSYDGCVEGATCGAGGVCVALASVGEPCEWFDSCVDTAYCGPEQVCSSRKADGAACGDYDECQNACVEGTCRKEPIVSAELCAGLPSN
jgi:hypothetical protein